MERDTRKAKNRKKTDHLWRDERGVVICGAGLAVVPAAAAAAHGAADRLGGASRATSACSAPRRPRPRAPGPGPHRRRSRVPIARPQSGPGRSPARLGPRPPRCRGAGSGSGSGSIERKISSFLATNRSRCDGAPCRAQGCRRRRSPRRMCCRCCYSPYRRSSFSRRLIPPRTLPAITDADESGDCREGILGKYESQMNWHR